MTARSRAEPTGGHFTVTIAGWGQSSVFSPFAFAFHVVLVRAMYRSVTSSSNGSSSPQPLKSRLPVSSASPRPASSHLLSARVTDPSPFLTASPSTLRVPKSPSARPRTISSNAKPSGSSSAQPSPSDRTRTRSTTKAPSRSRATEQEPATPSKAPALSLKETIALKRAEAKKAIATQKATAVHVSSAGIEDASPSALGGAAVDDDDLGRLSIRETIQRARSSGVCASVVIVLSFRLSSKTGRFAQYRITRSPLSPFSFVRDSSLCNTCQACYRARVTTFAR